MATRSFLFVLCLAFACTIDSRHLDHHHHHHSKQHRVRHLWDIIKGKFIDKFNFDNRHFRQHEMLLFPDIGFQSLNNNDTWKIIVHGWKYENPVRKSWLEIGADVWMAKFTRNLINQNDKLTINGSINYDRLRTFFVSDESNKLIKILIGDHEKSLSTDKYGQFLDQIDMTNQDVQNLKKEQGSDNVINYEATSNDNPKSIGIIRLIEPRHGISVISDIDDTIKISEVFDKIRLIANTFIFPFKPVPGMSDLYQQWQKSNKNCTFHYLSGMPDQLYTLTQEFIDDNNFPDGSFHMRHFGWAIGTLFDFIHPEATFNHKISYLRFFLSNTIRDFVLVGDSGEKDPETYATITKEYPERIRAIFIRAVKGESPSDQRFLNTFQSIPKEKWLIFDDPKQIPIDLSRAPRAIFS
ncbi:unnamed protein product [Rotaria socialis]|uniref:Phosphatidate phosphatase APP1 catalytic domain-containing protein n=1 Tax=Rotaria socialis TaxID=392032 RepID=A0A820RTY4_9BILA|nr:unnamed protein product [Rotaria socialis]CAF3288771.1 unnamed protein product [Rotaria socialis]CAF3389772.1 unnamed protein product [Rotaria socialis]CAF4234369.1 unnamed protein product [Rotaria socialis]CAF4444808.1 unnamed protein product [Rotaria socialis]